MIKRLTLPPSTFRISFVIYAALVLWASLRTGGGPQPIEHFDKVMHLSFYGLFTLIAAGCTQHKKTFIQLCIFIAAYGALMEFFQSFVPSRFMSIADIVANSAGVLLAAFFAIKYKFHNKE